MLKNIRLMTTVFIIDNNAFVITLGLLFIFSLFLSDVLLFAIHHLTGTLLKKSETKQSRALILLRVSDRFFLIQMKRNHF
jgi:hypothetical protein